MLMLDDTVKELSMGTDSTLMIMLESIDTQETMAHTPATMLTQAAKTENKETNIDATTGETGNEEIDTNTTGIASRSGGGEMRMNKIEHTEDVDPATGSQSARDSHTLVNICGTGTSAVHKDERSYGPSPSDSDLVANQEKGSNESLLYSPIEGIHQTKDDNLTEFGNNSQTTLQGPSPNHSAELGKLTSTVCNSRESSPLSSPGTYSPTTVPCSPFSSPNLVPTSSSPLSSPIQLPFSSSPSVLEGDEDHPFLLNKTDATIQLAKSLFDNVVPSDLCDPGTNRNNGTVLPDYSVENSAMQGTDGHEIQRRVEDSEGKLNAKRTIPKNELLYLPPNPKRPTAAAHRLQHEKLSKPFRPPRAIKDSVRQHSNQVLGDTMVSHGQQKREGSNLPVAGTKDTRSVEREMKYKQDDREKHRTTRASAQFKSPLLAQQDSTRATPAFRLTPTIQMLERKLQILKRAVKIKEDDQESVMRALISKWTNAGREVAWEVWTSVKENIQEVSVDDKRPYRESWGWKSPPSKRLRLNERTLDDVTQLDDGQEVAKDSSGEAGNSRIVSEDEEGPDEPHHTLGTMLRHLGIDPQTLGWNDDDEAFEDECEEQ